MLNILKFILAEFSWANRDKIGKIFAGKNRRNIAHYLLKYDSPVGHIKMLSAQPMARLM